MASKAFVGAFRPTLPTTRVTTEVHHVFSEVPQFGSLRRLPKFYFFVEKGMLRREKKKENGLDTQRESCKNKWRVSDDFGLRSVLSHSEPISDEKWYLYRITCMRL